MTRCQRKMHVLFWLVLGPVAVVGLVLAVMWRPVEPIQDGALPGIASETSEMSSTEQRETSGDGDQP